MTVTYFIFRRKYDDHYGFDIVAYRELSRPPVAVVRDVTVDGESAYAMTKAFNRGRLSPVHLVEVVLDMLG